MYIPTAQPQEIISAISKTEMRKDDVVAIFLGERNKPDVEQLIRELNDHDIEFFGGIFPGLIHGAQKYESGAIVVVLPALEKPRLIKGLGAEQVEMPEFSNIATDQGGNYTAMILVDGLTSNISLFLAKMFNRFGHSVNYFGGGAGSLDLQRKPCLFTPAGFFQDAAIVTVVSLTSDLGVRHGWKKISGPIVATRTDKNLIQELNWRNAFEVYRTIVEADSGATLTKENFFSIAKGYPFGIYKEGSEEIVRDPLAVGEEGELICVGEVPENAVLNILKGESAALIAAAGQAAADCQNLGRRKPYQSLVVDYISRVLFLEEDFGRELAAVKGNIAANFPECIPEGVLTLGEISSDGEGYLEFFNKTLVVGILYE